MDKTKPPRIVLIEDNPADVHLLRYALDLTAEAYELELLPDGEEALHFVRDRRCGEPESAPCVIVLDLHLPRIDGREVLEAIKADPELSHLRVVVLTSSASPEEEESVRSLGVNLYLKKPSQLVEFEDVAREIIAVCKDRALMAMV